MNSFTISVHARKQAQKRFKWRESSLIKEIEKAISHGQRLTADDGIYYDHNGIRFIFRENKLITVFRN